MNNKFYVTLSATFLSRLFSTFVCCLRDVVPEAHNWPIKQRRLLILLALRKVYSLGHDKLITIDEENARFVRIGLEKRSFCFL